MPQLHHYPCVWFNMYLMGLKPSRRVVQGRCCSIRLMCHRRQTVARWCSSICWWCMLWLTSIAWCRSPVSYCCWHVACKAGAETCRKGGERVVSGRRDACREEKKEVRCTRAEGKGLGDGQECSRPAIEEVRWTREWKLSMTQKQNREKVRRLPEMYKQYLGVTTFT